MDTGALQHLYSCSLKIQHNISYITNCFFPYVRFLMGVLVITNYSSFG